LIENNLMATETFILKFLSPETGCSAHELKFRAEVELVASILEVDAETLASHLYPVDPDKLSALAMLRGYAFPVWEGEIWLDTSRWLDGVPYLVHTNFELPLMLDGRKPFAWFSGEKDWLDEWLRYFTPYVENGTIICRRQTRSAKSLTLVEVLFALPGEEWRFTAYDVLMKERRPWTDDMERRLGMLLGYVEEQRDWWSSNQPVADTTTHT